jgi:acetolactate synthase-1/2/3 large subunit
MSEQMTGAKSLVRSLEEAGVETVFGIPGARSCRSTTRSSTASGSATSWCGTSRAPGHAAQGYAVASGRVGVCMATSGPGPPTW